MDLVTHALTGAQAACLGARRGAETEMSPRERLLLGAVAGVFPDIDFIGFAVDPLRYLACWHQGPTHSLVLLPGWALLIAAGWCAATRRRRAFGTALLTGGLGLASHIVLDVLTVYGTRVLYPLSERRVSLGTTFIIDPLFTTIVVASLAAGMRSGRHRVAALACVVGLGVLVGWQDGLRRQALRLAEEGAMQTRPAATRGGRGHERGGDVGGNRSGGGSNGNSGDSDRSNNNNNNSSKNTANNDSGSTGDGAAIVALPQPFSPFNWKLVVTEPAGASAEAYLVAHVNLAGHPPLVPRLPGFGRWRAVAQAYAPPERLEWERRSRFGADPRLRPLARALWQRPDFAPFRHFAVFPALSRVDDDAGRRCVWFTDLRYDLPALPDTFRYGHCQLPPGMPWRPFRLRYFTHDGLQPLAAALPDARTCAATGNR